MAKNCTHLDQIQDVTPSANGCEDCLKIGDTWSTCASVSCVDMWAVATLQRTSTLPGISTRATIRSFSPSSQERTGSGVTSIR